MLFANFTYYVNILPYMERYIKCPSKSHKLLLCDQSLCNNCFNISTINYIIDYSPDFWQLLRYHCWLWLTCTCNPLLIYKTVNNDSWNCSTSGFFSLKESIDIQTGDYRHVSIHLFLNVKVEIRLVQMYWVPQWFRFIKQRPEFNKSNMLWTKAWWHATIIAIQLVPDLQHVYASCMY